MCMCVTGNVMLDVFHFRRVVFVITTVMRIAGCQTNHKPLQNTNYMFSLPLFTSFPTSIHTNTYICKHTYIQTMYRFKLWEHVLELRQVLLKMFAAYFMKHRFSLDRMVYGLHKSPHKGWNTKMCVPVCLLAHRSNEDEPNRWFTRLAPTTAKCLAK